MAFILAQATCHGTDTRALVGAVLAAGSKAPRGFKPVSKTRDLVAIALTGLHYVAESPAIIARLERNLEWPPHKNYSA